MKRWLVLVGLSGIIWLIDGQGGWEWLKRPVTKMVQPVRKGLYSFKVKDQSMEEIEAGKGVILEAEMVKLRQENERMRELLGSQLPPNWQFVMANVLKREKAKVIIDVGEKMGVKEGGVVMGLVVEGINNGVLIGKIKTVKAFESAVELLVSEGMEVRVKTESGVKGKVVGEGERLKLTEVLQKDKLNEGELLLSEGKDGWLTDLVVGRVGRIASQETAVFQEAEVVPVVGVESLKKLWVVSLLE